MLGILPGNTDESIPCLTKNKKYSTFLCPAALRGLEEGPGAGIGDWVDRPIGIANIKGQEREAGVVKRQAMRMGGEFRP